ncbi:hypothetical protein GP486_004454 [Trichoglossum hirsutum]|uniref:CARDB domain-containing protein n=1 Tax=Trichoglossum hirsutum TaxID=265104 RepID=A0A9P8RPP6_9PEZI|nr:hypothetical protein GP486_004454 [Trichoglossum hirsutum]
MEYGDHKHGGQKCCDGHRTGEGCGCGCCCHHGEQNGEMIPRLSLKDISPRLPNYMVDKHKQERFLANYPSKDCRPHIAEFSPWSAYPSSLVVIIGHGFAPRRELNTVTIGGHRALVVTAERHRLVVISDFKTRDGPVCVKTHCGEATGARDFKVLYWPAPYPAPEVDGPPYSFEGVGDGKWTDFRSKSITSRRSLRPSPTFTVQSLNVPSTGTAKVLIVCCYPWDTPPADPTATKARVTSKGAAMTTYYNQASYGRLNVSVDVTDYHAMADTFDYYYRESSPTDGGYPNFKRELLPQIKAEGAYLANSNGYNLDNYDVLMMIIYVEKFVRAWGGGDPTGPNFSYTQAPSNSRAPGKDPVSFNFTIGRTLGSVVLGDKAALSTDDANADWGRYSHEFGHNVVTPAAILGEDLYAADTSPGADVSGAEFDLMGYHDDHPLFSGYNIDHLGWFDDTPNGGRNNVLALNWNTTPFLQDVEIVAHGLTPNSNSSRYHLVRIQVSSGLEYYIEVRQKPGATAQVFDTNLPVPAGQDGGVLVTRSISGTINNNESIRLITLLQSSQTTLTNGQVAVDPLRTILITVLDDNVQAAPRVCRVRIEWAQPAQDTPGGTFDLWIQPWGPGYVTPDIWIVNPDGGDVPVLGRINQFNARIHNDGTTEADNVVTTFYVNTPPGIGDSGNWTPLKAVTIPTIAGETSVVLGAEWDPKVDQHTCLQVAIVPQTGEKIVSNNRAQENIFKFQPPSHSVPEPVELSVAVRNPLKKRTLIWISLDGVPEGFYAYFPHRYVYLEALAERNLEILVIPLREIPDLTAKVANVRVHGYIPWSYEKMMPINGLPPASTSRLIGGIQASVTPKVGSQITLQPNPRVVDNGVGVTGNVTPATPEQVVRVDMTWDDGHRDSQAAKTDRSGAFRAWFPLSRREIDWIQVRATRTTVALAFQAHIVDATVLAPSDSNIVHFVTSIGRDIPEGPR